MHATTLTWKFVQEIYEHDFSLFGSLLENKRSIVKVDTSRCLDKSLLYKKYVSDDYAIGVFLFYN